MSDLVTGEAVPLEMRLARLPSRMLAFLIDALILLAVAVGWLLLLVQIAPAVDEALGAAIAIASVVFIAIVIPTTVETLSHGRSTGKLALGLRVVRDDGGPVRLRHALIRAMAGIFADFAITLGLGALVCASLNPRDKRIGDLLAGTMVVRERIPSAPPPPPIADPVLAAWATSLDLSRLPNDLALTARTLLARASSLAPEARDRLAAELATEVAAVVTPPPPQNTAALPYLSAVLSERNRREALRYTDTPPAPTPTPAAPPRPSPQRPSTDNGGFVPPS